MGRVKKKIAFKNTKDLLEQVKQNTLLYMITTAEKQLNPNHYQISEEAKKRLKWLYNLYYEHDGNVSRAARKTGISREWLSKLKSVFERNGKDPRKLEPKSKAPINTSNRNRISKEIEMKIIETRDKYYNSWGKEKIANVLKTEHQIKVNPNTINKYLHKHKRINPKISNKNKRAYEDKKKRENDKYIMKVKYRPPKQIKDLVPGALIEKDMKYIEKQGNLNKLKERNNFFYQHTEIDSFTRLRTLEITKTFEGYEVVMAHKKAKSRFPFEIACVNSDNGIENNGAFEEGLQKENIFHFYSNMGTPTDNPRVERSHLTDEQEFLSKGNRFNSLEEQKDAATKWEHIYNFIRPHQALGYLTPIAFYELWKKDPVRAYDIKNKYQAYLEKQKRRLAGARRIKRKEQIETLMKFIDAKLNNKKVVVNQSKLQLINCELCSVA